MKQKFTEEEMENFTGGARKPFVGKGEDGTWLRKQGSLYALERLQTYIGEVPR